MFFRQIGPCQNTIQWAVAIAGRVYHPSHPKCSVGVREGLAAAQGLGQSIRYSMGHYQMVVTLAHSTTSQSQEEILTGTAYISLQCNLDVFWVICGLLYLWDLWQLHIVPFLFMLRAAAGSLQRLLFLSSDLSFTRVKSWQSFGSCLASSNFYFVSLWNWLSLFSPVDHNFSCYGH